MMNKRGISNISMHIHDFSPDELRAHCRGGGIDVKTGPFWVRISSDAPTFYHPFHQLYADYPAAIDRDIVDYHVSIDTTSWLRRFIRPQILFKHDGDGPFYPLPAAEASVMLEWGLNWCISTHAHQFLIIHAAVVARGDDAMLMSAPSRSGKSTLTAALIHHGWRLLSDELALIEVGTGLVHPLCRPVNLKAGSIDVIRDFVPEAALYGQATNLQKGDVALMRVPGHSIAQMDRPARVRWLVQPSYIAGASPVVRLMNGGEAMMQLAQNSFNYGVLEEAGFDVLSALVAGAERFEYHYSDLADAVADLGALAEGEWEQAA